MYKVSKFTYSCINSNNELLLYNTYIGTRSFCKFKDVEYRNIFNRSDIFDLNDTLSKQLLEKGIIVSETVDENQKLYCQFIQNINTNKLVLFINATEQCNFRCRYCYESFAHGEMTKEIQDKIIKFVKENIYQYSGLHIAWFGGEPLLSLNGITYLSEKLINICNFNKRNYEASITTNGYLLNGDIFDKLLNLRVKQFQITIDGTKDMHDKYRVTHNGSPTYKKIFDNLIEIKKKKRKDFSIILRSNLTQEIFCEIDNYLDNLDTLCSDDSRFSVAIFKAGNWLDKAQQEIKDQLIEDANCLKIIYQAILNSNKKINLSTNFLNPGSGACYAGKLNNYLICADGSIHKCTVTFEDKESIVGKFENGVIINDDKFYSMITNFNKCEDYYKCFNAPICMGYPCPIKQSTNNNCSYYKNSLDIILQIFDKQNHFITISEE